MRAAPPRGWISVREFSHGNLCAHELCGNLSAINNFELVMETSERCLFAQLEWKAFTASRSFANLERGENSFKAASVATGSLAPLNCSSRSIYD